MEHEAHSSSSSYGDIVLVDYYDVVSLVMYGHQTGTGISDRTIMVAVDGKPPKPHILIRY